MNWLVWRQHRWDAASAAAVLVVLGGGMLILTIGGAALLAEISRACSTAPPSSECQGLQLRYGSSYGTFQTFITAAGMVIPAVIGVFVGAPMVAREFELGTHLVVWAQGITRRRWFFTKALLLAVATLIATGLLGLIYEIWLAPQSSTINIWYSFEVAPVVLAAYSLFALMLGISLGTIIQRTVPAMAATLAIFTALRIAIAQFIRPIYLPPLTWDVGKNIPGDSSFLFIGTLKHVDLSGNAISDARWNQLVQQCSTTVTSGKATGSPLHDCLLSHGVLAVQQYQPDSRFWVFQGIEAAIFMSLALLLAVVAYRFIVRKG
jgi:hypothetical protein